MTRPAPAPQRSSTAPAPARGSATRRGLLLGAGGAVAAGVVAGVAVQEGVLPGRARAHRWLGLDGPAGHVPDVQPGLTVSGSFVSRARLGARTGWSIVYPGPRRQRLPVMVCLHGLGGDHTSAVDELGIDRFLVAAVDAGIPPFAVATADGGTTYWHPRPSGEDAGAMVVDELLPLLAAHGLDTSRLAFQGWSMGGYGALRLAGLLGSARVRAAAAVSAALWTDPASASPSGFADSAEYREFSVLGHQRDLDHQAVRVDCGTDDPFYDADRAYVAGFHRPVAHSWQPGAHDAAYWTRMLPAQLGFVGRALGSAG